MNPPTSAIVLAGGQSRRLGRDKRALRLATSRTQLEETIARVALVADDVVVAGATDLASDQGPGIRWIADSRVGLGPLSGLVAGFATVRNEYALVVACDLPLLNVELLRALTAWPREFDLLVPRRPDGTLEMLHAVYRATCLPIATRRLDAGRLRLAGLADDLLAAGLVVRFVDDAEIGRYDPFLKSFFNVNTPEDLAMAERLVGDQVIHQVE